MPNFKLGDHYKNIIKVGVSSVLENYVKGFTNNFPLTHEEVQSCIMSRETLSQFEMLWAGGVRTIRRSQGLTCLLDREATAGLKRSCALLLRSTVDFGFFTEKDAQPHIYVLQEELSRDRVTRLDLRRLDPHRRLLVIDWAHELIRATRLREMVNATVGNALTHCATTAGLLATWPELASFAKDDGALRKRLAAPPQKLEKYRVADHWLPPKRQREAANVVLTMGAMAMSADKNTDESEVHGSILTFEKLPTDPVF